MAPPSTPDKHPTKEMYNDIIDIKVGVEPHVKTFKAHKGIVCLYSGFFDKTLNGEFEEAKNGVVTLPEGAPRDVNRLIMWAYSGILDDNKEYNNFQILCQLWAFADRREVPLLMNVCIDAIRDKIVTIRKVPTPQLKYIYQNSTAGAGIRRFAIDIIGKTVAPQRLEAPGVRVYYNEEILWDLLKVVWDSAKTASLTKAEVAGIDTCPYHWHEEGVRCAPQAK